MRQFQKKIRQNSKWLSPKFNGHRRELQILFYFSMFIWNHFYFQTFWYEKLDISCKKSVSFNFSIFPLSHIWTFAILLKQKSFCEHRNLQKCAGPWCTKRCKTSFAYYFACLGLMMPDISGRRSVCKCACANFKTCNFIAM